MRSSRRTGLVLSGDVAVFTDHTLLPRRRVRRCIEPRQYTRAPSKELKKSAAPGALSLIRNPFHVLIGLRTMRNTVIA
jgi:hypothetical protein